MRPLSLAALPLVALTTLALGCAMKNEAEDQSSAPAPAEAELPGAVEEATLAEDEPAARAANEERSFEDLQRELAANEARLISLGVKVPSAAAEDDADRADGAEAKDEKKKRDTAPQRERGGDKKPSAGGGSGSGIAGQQPGGRSNEGPRSAPNKQEDSRAEPDRGARDHLEGAKPEGAHATPPSPDEDRRGQDAATQCQQICDLSQVTCGLQQQICDLADRHHDETEYEDACERAVSDCELAKEACHACFG